MLTEQDCREVLEDLGFDIEATPRPNTGLVSPALRHSTRRFVGIPSRTAGNDAFWPTLYWNMSGDFVYFSTAARDVEHFRSEFWTHPSSERVLPHEAFAVSVDGETRPAYCFVPLATRAGLRRALESLFLAQPNW